MDQKQPYLIALDRKKFNVAMSRWPLANPDYSPDPKKVIRDVVNDIVYNHYKYYRIFTVDEDRFFDELENQAYETMVQLQYVMSEFLMLIEAEEGDQFFFNTVDEKTRRVGDRKTTGSDTTKTNQLNIHSDTPETSIADIEQYMSSADKDTGDNTSNTVGTAKDEDDFTRSVKQSTLGDISVQFQHFIEFHDIYQKIIVGFSSCFRNVFDEEEI